MASPNSAWIDLSDDAWVTEVAGADAGGWLGDLITADVAGLAVGQATRSLLLTPTGKIRADLWLARAGEERFVLLQPADQPDPVRTALAPYILSSQVTLRSLDGVERVLSLPPGAPEFAGGLWAAAPSPVDAACSLVAIAPAARDDAAAELAAAGIERAGIADVERFRIEQGSARFPVDLLPASVPAEDEQALAAIDTTKGCFLGQESVAKIRNLGHPPHVVRSFRTAGPAAVGEHIVGPGGDVGSVTSVSANPAGGSAVIARLAWRAAQDVSEGFRTAAGSVLESRTPVR